MVVTRELNDDLDSVGSLVIPAGGRPDADTAEGYNAERGRVEDMDVIAGLRELDTGQGIKWRVERVNSDDPAQDGFLKEIPTEALTLEGLTNRFGAGQYKITGRYPGGQYAASRRVKIASDAPRLSSQTGAMQTHASPSLAFDEFERRQEARDEKRRKDRNDLLAIAIPAMAPIVAALLGNRGPDVAALVTALKPAPPPDPIQQLAALKALMPDTTAVNPLDSAMKIVELLRDAGGDGGDSAGMMDIIKEVIRNPQAIGALGSMLQRPAASAVPALPAPDSATTLINAPAQPVEGSPAMFGMLTLLPWLKEQMAMALRKAAGGSDPELIAERIVDDLPRGAKPEELAKLLAREDWFAQLQKFDSRVSGHVEWFTQMREAMLAIFNNDESEPADESASQMSVRIEPKSTEIDRPKGPPSLTGEGS